MKNITDTGVGCRLNLGCGDDVRSGYLNVDFRQTHPNVIMVDLSTYPWPFADMCAKEVLLLDFLEHFPYAKTRQILLECFRVLEPNGQVIIQVPDAGILGAVLCGDTGGNLSIQCNFCGAHSWVFADGRPYACSACHRKYDDILDSAVMRLFGGQDYPGNWHQVAFTKESLRRKAEQCGLVFEQWLESEHQAANWNCKGSFRKGDVW